MKVIFSHPTGNQNSRNVALGLLRNDMLSQFYTTFGIFSDSSLQKFDNAIFKEIKKRTYDTSLKSRTTFFPFNEITRLLLLKSKLSKFVNLENNRFSAQNIYSTLDYYIANNFLKYTPDLVYGYGAGSMNTFIKAKNNNIKTVYDLPACHWRKIYEIVNLEKNNNPNWADTMDVLGYSESFLNRCDKELELADKIIVASKFCKKSLDLFPQKLNDIKIIPYGFPQVYKNRIYNKSKKLKVLYVGALNQQKGISYLFDAIEPYSKHLELTLIGSLPNKKHILLERKLSQHNYLGTLPHGKVLEIMRENDVLIFPTIMDAYGMVISEAMSQGTPVITTENSAGPELIKHGENGWIVDSGNSYQIKNIIESILHKNDISEIGNNALITAEIRPWEIYQNEVCDFIKEITND